MKKAKVIVVAMAIAALSSGCTLGKHRASGHGNGTVAEGDLMRIEEAANRAEAAANRAEAAADRATMSSERSEAVFHKGLRK